MGTLRSPSCTLSVAHPETTDPDPEANPTQPNPARPCPAQASSPAAQPLPSVAPDGSVSLPHPARGRQGKDLKPKPAQSHASELVCEPCRITEQLNLVPHFPRSPQGMGTVLTNL